MIPELREQFAAGRRYLVVDCEGNKVALETADAMIDPARPVTIYDLGAALESFGRIVGEDANEFRFWQLGQIGAMSSSLLDKWMADGIIAASVKPSRGPGRGNERIFSRADAFLVGVLGSLRRQGMPPASLKTAADFLRSFESASSPVAPTAEVK